MNLRKVQYQRGSLAIIVPKPLAEQLKLEIGGYVEVGLLNEYTIIVRKHQMGGHQRRYVRR